MPKFIDWAESKPLKETPEATDMALVVTADGLLRRVALDTIPPEES